MKKQFKELVQLAGCEECSFARKERLDRFRNLIVTPEICKFGGKVAAEKGNRIKYSCNQ